jgi:hypothetical protein
MGFKILMEKNSSYVPWPEEFISTDLVDDEVLSAFPCYFRLNCDELNDDEFIFLEGCKFFSDDGDDD